jgi:hypothetical protein
LSKYMYCILMLPSTYLLCNVPTFPSDRNMELEEGNPEAQQSGTSILISGATRTGPVLSPLIIPIQYMYSLFCSNCYILVLPVLLQLRHTCNPCFPTTATYLYSLFCCYGYILLLMFTEICLCHFLMNTDDKCYRMWENGW